MNDMFAIFLDSFVLRRLIQIIAILVQTLLKAGNVGTYQKSHVRRQPYGLVSLRDNGYVKNRPQIVLRPLIW